MNPFEYLNSINYSKKDIMVDDLDEKEYDSFLINRSLSYFSDTVVFANVMNQYHHLDPKMKFHFLINIVRKRKRFSKWVKKEQQSDIEVIKQYYGYNDEKARQVKSLLSPTQLAELKEKVNKSGIRKL